MLPPLRLCGPRRQINQHHGCGAESFDMTGRRSDYFVRYLLGAEPPHEYELHPPAPGPGM
jgi:hypothetical protein